MGRQQQVGAGMNVSTYLGQLAHTNNQTAQTLTDKSSAASIHQNLVTSNNMSKDTANLLNCNNNLTRQFALLESMRFSTPIEYERQLMQSDLLQQS